jgi:hypothetical protein
MEREGNYEMMLHVQAEKTALLTIDKNMQVLRVKYPYQVLTPTQQRIVDAVKREARRYFDRDPESTNVQITTVEVADTWSEPYEWDVRVKWVDSTDNDQEQTPKDDLLYTVTVNEQGEVVDITGPEL